MPAAPWHGPRHTHAKTDTTEAMTPHPTDPASPPLPPLLSGHKGYVLVVLFLVYALNYVDRQILVILGQPIKLEFGLKDWQLGFLTGTAFALFYATLGLPIARIADRANRVSIIAAALAIWSGMTSLCAATASFAQLAAARVGVGVGEAGGGPPSVSLIASYFDRRQRSTAMGIYSLGPTVGILIGFVVGGWVSQRYGWRAAMLVAGLPGLALAVLVKLTVREPRVEPGAPEPVVEVLPPFGETVRTLFGTRAYTMVIIATVGAGITVYGFMVWVPAYLIREYGLSTREVGTTVGLCAGIAGSFGVFAGGWLADLLGRRNHRWYLYIPALTTIVFYPLILGVLHAGSAKLAFIFLVPAYMVALAYTGPSWAVVQTIAPPQLRAMAAAILLFLVNLIGLGIGPQVVGLLSDVFQPDRGTAGGLSLAIAIVTSVAFPASIFFYLGARALPAEAYGQARPDRVHIATPLHRS